MEFTREAVVVAPGAQRKAPCLGRRIRRALRSSVVLDDLITRRYSIVEADQAFRDLAAGAFAHGLIVF